MRQCTPNDSKRPDYVDCGAVVRVFRFYRVVRREGVSEIPKTIEVRIVLRLS